MSPLSHPALVSTPRGRITAVVIRHGYVSLRSPHRLLHVVLWPVIDMLLYGTIAMYVRQAGASPAASRTALSVVAGIIMWNVTYQAQVAVSTSFFEEIYSRQLPSLLTTPLRPVEWVLGAALQGLVKVALGVSAVSLAALALFGFNVTAAGLALVPAMALLLVTGWALALLILGLVMFLGSGTEALAYSLLFLILPLSGAFFPISVLPPVVRPISMVLPTTYIFRAARDAAIGGAPVWGELGVAALATGGLTVVVLAFATYALRVFQRRGSIGRYQ
jgi:ABC-2 type transport system permease protein